MATKITSGQRLNEEQIKEKNLELRQAHGKILNSIAQFMLSDDVKRADMAAKARGAISDFRSLAIELGGFAIIREGITVGFGNYGRMETKHLIVDSDMLAMTIKVVGNDGKDTYFNAFAGAGNKVVLNSDPHFAAEIFSGKFDKGQVADEFREIKHLTSDAAITIVTGPQELDRTSKEILAELNRF
ncbi:MAG: hypothetical protein KGH49_04060 [Candidatus Micrarchaeota archaeon]|nr:hypothetical protein [Candidatus Micrarchaeota archaeon]